MKEGDIIRLIRPPDNMWFDTENVYHSLDEFAHGKLFKYIGPHPPSAVGNERIVISNLDGSYTFRGVKRDRFEPFL